MTWVSPKSDPALYRRSSPFISRTLALSDPKILFAKKNRPIPLAQVALPESFWLEWLQDELPLATEPAEVEALDDLHRRACAMCPTGPVWLARCALHRERSSDAGKVRSVYEEALKVLGQHPGYGVEIWADYRDFEENLLSAAGADEKALQVQRVRTLFMRQMALPLPGRERLQETHQTFEGAGRSREEVGVLVSRSGKWSTFSCSRPTEVGVPHVTWSVCMGKRNPKSPRPGVLGGPPTSS
ncbi:unnamed protein product [Durusdinium trenchii]|uniref:Uncharacterized protein n=1 Tax=Durusdinium trenchii TaxID=1381693 RepID=A0ABP0RLA7_9DINO